MKLPWLTQFQYKRWGCFADLYQPMQMMEPAMRALVLGFALVTLLSIEPAHAQNYPWCGDRGDGSTSCGYVSYEQCMQKYRNCSRNPMYQPPATKRSRS